MKPNRRSRHLGVCLDLCHAAVEFEDPADCLRALAGAGIPIAKMQVTAGLRIPRVTAEAVTGLQGFDEAVYLHQVVERGTGALRRYVDIDAACASETWHRGDCEWRVHFHVPVFLEQLEDFPRRSPLFARFWPCTGRRRGRSTSRSRPIRGPCCPPRARDVPIEEAIARELLWVQDELA